jgi:glucose/arabinose dehydrogenase
LLVGSLSLQEFRRIELKEGQIEHEELLFKSYGRIRDIVTGPDGYLYLAIEGGERGGKIARLVPTARTALP